MADILSSSERSARMALIRSKDTQPEHIVRKLVSALGCRYRLNCRDLPGKPDLIFRRQKKIIFVHGCFWHQHDTKACRPRRPKSRKAYWNPKLERNKARDKEVARTLRRQGWKLLVVWECETRNLERLSRRLSQFLSL